MTTLMSTNSDDSVIITLQYEQSVWKGCFTWWRIHKSPTCCPEGQSRTVSQCGRPTHAPASWWNGQTRLSTKKKLSKFNSKKLFQLV